MVRDDMIFAKLEHYSNMVNFLGCANPLQKVDNMVLAMPCELNVWMILFNVCKIHGNVEMVKHIVAQIFEMELDNVIDCVVIIHPCYCWQHASTAWVATIIVNTN
jgi:hypothetical protein